jgi:hypothetical protein
MEFTKPPLRRSTGIRHSSAVETVRRVSPIVRGNDEIVHPKVTRSAVESASQIKEYSICTAALAKNGAVSGAKLFAPLL